MQGTMRRTETGNKGSEIYQREIREAIELPENIGQLVAIDVDSHDYEIGSDLVMTVDRLKARHPAGRIWTKRIGYNAVVTFGGSIERTAP